MSGLVRCRICDQLLFSTSPRRIRTRYRVSRFLAWTLFFSALLSVGCEDAKESLKNGRGLVSHVFMDDEGRERRYLVFLPRDFSPGDRRPVILFLNGHGENGIDGLRQISNNFGAEVWQMRDFFPFVVVAPQCPPNGNWTAHGAEAEAALAILDKVAREYGTDADRVYLTGVSSGGWGVWSMASAYPERFAAIVPLCGNGGNMNAIAEANLPIWNFYNDGDTSSLVQSSRAARDALIRLGRSPLVTEYRKTGHDCWTEAYSSETLYAWLLGQSRRQNRQRAQRFSFVEPERILKQWPRRGAGEWHVEGGDTLVSTGAEGEPAAVLSPESIGDCEIHVDARWPSGAALRIGFFESEAAAPALIVSVPFAKEGLGGVSMPDRTIARLDPVGQRQLREGGWSDVRLLKEDDRLSVTINGCPALECRDPALRREYCFGLLSPDAPDVEIRWRYLRWRSPDGE